MINKILSRFNRPTPSDTTGPNEASASLANSPSNDKSAYLFNGDQVPQSHAQCVAIARSIYSDYLSISRVSAKTPLKKSMSPQPFERYVVQLHLLRSGLTNVTERHDSLPDSVEGDPALNWQAAALPFLPFVATLATGVEQLTDLCSIVAEAASEGNTTVAIQGKQLRRYTDLLRILNETDAAIDRDYKMLSQSLGL